MDHVLVEGLLVIAAGRAYVSSRPGALARPRRGNVDLPDLDAPGRGTPRAPADVAEPVAATDRWILPMGIAAVVGGGLVARAAVLLI